MPDYTRDPTAVKASSQALRIIPPNRVPIADPFFTKSGLEITIPGSGIVTPGALIAGEDIEAGQPCRIDPTDSLVYLSDANAVDPGNDCDGVAENTASTGQAVSLVYSDPEWTHGLNAIAGDIPIVSATKGEIIESSGKASGYRLSTLGIVTDTNKMILNITHTSVAM